MSGGRAVEPPGQLRIEAPPPGEGGPARTVISAARDVELGARSMLLLAEGLFRLDVVPYADTVQTIVRSLSTEPQAELRSSGEVGGESRASGENASRSTTRFGGEIVLIGEDGAERVVSKVLVGSICDLDRGLSTFTAQAILL